MVTTLALASSVVVVALTWRTIAFQILLKRSSMKHPELRDSARLFCERIVANDAPTAAWLASVDDWNKVHDKTNYFYFLKVHFTECQTPLGDIRRGRIWVFQETPTNAAGNFYYQRDAPHLQMAFAKAGSEGYKMRAYFPLNNCLFDPDLNRDGRVDHKDVEAASHLEK